MAEVEADRSKLSVVIREKEKVFDQAVKSWREEIENLKREASRKDSELKKAQEENRDIVVKGKTKISELEAELLKSQD